MSLTTVLTGRGANVPHSWGGFSGYVARIPINLSWWVLYALKAPLNRSSGTHCIGNPDEESSCQKMPTRGIEGEQFSNPTARQVGQAARNLSQPPGLEIIPSDAQLFR